MGRAGSMVVGRLAVGMVLVACLAMSPTNNRGLGAEGRPLIYGAALPLAPLNALTNEWTEASVAILSRLFTIDLNGQLIGDLVESYEVSLNGLTWTLHLRPGVRWHDGRTFSSDDVLFTFEEARKPTTRLQRWRDVSVIDRFEAPAPLVFVMHLKVPQPKLGVPLVDLPILPRHVYAGRDVNDDATFDARPIGTGPYRVAERTADGRLVLEAHEPYHLGKPGISKLVLVPIEDDEARAKAVVEGVVDLAHIKPQQKSLFDGRPDRVVYRYRSGIWRSLVLNVRRPHLADRRVRQAIASVLDREAMVKEALAGVGSPAWSPIPPINPDFQPGVQPSGAGHPPDADRARALLDRAGWRAGADGWRRRDGTRLELTLAVWWDEPFRRAASEVVKRNLEAVGVGVGFAHIAGVDYEPTAANLGDRYDGIITGYSGLLDTGDNLATKYRTGGSQNAGGYSNAELDALLDQARQESDQTRARALYGRALAIIEADAARIPLVYVDYLFAARRDLAGMGPHVLDYYYHFPRIAYRLSWGL